MLARTVLVMLMFCVSGCTSWPISPSTPGDPKGAQAQGYHPLDPLPVNLIDTGDQSILNFLPDETIRIAVGELSGEGTVTFGPATAGYNGKNYVVILDYVKFSTDSIPVNITEEEGPEKTRKVATLVKEGSDLKANMFVPVYIGVGLRLTANVHVNEGKVNLGSLFALGLEAKAGNISGTLVVQTLGISGREVTSLIPMPGEISESTIQNSIQALSLIKSKLYDDETSKTPRIVGVYNNLGGGSETINGFISSLLEEQIDFP